MSLKKIRLELARTPGFPEGSGRHGYEFTAPLDAKGNLDAAGWAKAKEACSVLRFWDGEPDEHGALIHRRDGKWAFSNAPGDDDDEPVTRRGRGICVSWQSDPEYEPGVVEITA